MSLPGGRLSVPPLEDLSTLAAFPPFPKVEPLPFDGGVLRFDGPSLMKLSTINDENSLSTVSIHCADGVRVQ